MSKFLTNEERKNSEFVFQVLDWTIEMFGIARLDCGHHTDGSRVGAIKDEGDRYYLFCFDCFDKWTKEHNIKSEIESIERKEIK